MVRKDSYKPFRKMKGGQLELTPLKDYEKRLPPYDDSVPAGSNRHVSRLPELFSDFYQPSVADFALIDASRIDVNLCEGSSE